MSDIIFIRHASTDLAGTFCGHTDPALNEAGKRQAALLQKQFEDRAIDHIYSSNLRRAYSTAMYLAHDDASRITTCTALREIFFGEWEGLTWAEIEHQDPHFASQWLAEYPLISPPQGERFEDFSTRVMAEVARIEKASRHQSVAVVTHAGVMREILEKRCGLTAQQAWEKTREYCCTFTLTGTA